MMRFLS